LLLIVMRLSTLSTRKRRRVPIRIACTLALVLVLGLVLVPSASALRFTDDSYLVTEGAVGEYYAHQFQGEGGCGPMLPYQFRVLQGGLPPGLSLTGDGLLVGIPTQAGSWSFWVELSDEDPPSEQWCFPRKSEREFTVNIVSALAITTESAAPATRATPYSLRLSAQGGSGTRTWSIASGELPPGLALNSASGEISGSPTAAGTFEFRVRVSDGSRLASKAFMLSVREPLAAYARTVPPAEVSIPIAAVKVAATGGSASKTWRLEGSLPRGLIFDTGNAVITGTPEVAGVFSVKLVVSDGEGRTDDVRLTLVVSPKILLALKSLPRATTGLLYQARITARDGVGATTFKLVAGRLPSGLRLDSKAGVLSGRPSAAGRSRFVIEVRDKLGATARATYVLSVR
jgi:large repetitive protein